MVQSHSSSRSRLNLLVSYGGWRSESWADQLPRLLDPFGIHSIRAQTGKAATEIIQSQPVHIAVVDLSIPLNERKQESSVNEPAGLRILQLLRRLDQPPPTVVVRPATTSHRESDRTLATALREGAFAVLDHPVHLESMLEVMRRILRRHYANNWPAA